MEKKHELVKKEKQASLYPEMWFYGIMWIYDANSAECSGRGRFFGRGWAFPSSSLGAARPKRKFSRPPRSSEVRTTSPVVNLHPSITSLCVPQNGSGR